MKRTKNNSNNNNDESTLSDQEDDNRFKKKKSIDFSIKKPGDHAKADEWRKWKQMKREIKQTRIEKKLSRKETLNDNKNSENFDDNEINDGNGREYTLSIAIASSIISKVQSKQLKTYVCGQIARAACLHCVDEIIVYNDNSIDNKKCAYEDDNQLMIKIFEYLECPQYLRKLFFPSQKLLEYVGLLIPLDAPHHLRINDNWLYREGVTTEILCKKDNSCWVDVGLMNKVLVDKKLKPGIRVTVKKLDDNNNKGVIVCPNTPRISHGLYWGYQVRYANTFSKIFNECPYNERYDLKISSSQNSLNFDSLDDFPKYKHVLIVFCGAQTIENVIESDETFKSNKINSLFDYLINKQKPMGSKTVRSEEAILLTLSNIKNKLDNVWLKTNESKLIEINNNNENSNQVT